MASVGAQMRADGYPLNPPKHIKIDGHRIHLRFIQSLAWVIPVTSLTVAVVAALYYLITQKGYFFPKSSWDNLFSYSWWPNYRHGLRDVGEPVVAAMLVHSFIVSSWKKHGEAASGLRLAGHVVASLVMAFILIILGTGVIDYVLPSRLASSSVNTGVAGTLNLTFILPFVFSFIVVHAVRSVWGPVGNAISLAFTEAAVRRAKGKLPLWVRKPLAPPAVRERFVWVQQTTPVADLKTGALVRWLVALAGLAYLALAGYGEYVLHVIAKG